MPVKNYRGKLSPVVFVVVVVVIVVIVVVVVPI
jgi:hypothetical protein